MPASVPDASDYVRMKRLKLQVYGNNAIASQKTRAPYAYGFYTPKFLNILPSFLLPGRLVP